MSPQAPQPAQRRLLHHPLTLPMALALSASLVAGSLAFAVAWFREPSADLGVLQAPVKTATLAAYIVGAVVHPGTYTLASPARTLDLVRAAGGATADADLARVNMAAPLTDGAEVYVPRVGEPLPDTSSTATPTMRVNINLASAAMLHTQLGISLKLAQRIVLYRQQHGRFTALDQLLLVPISAAQLKRLQPRLAL